MRRNWLIVFFGVIEILIGAVTLTAVAASMLLGRSSKPPEVLIFVLITAIVSFGLGIGVLRRNLTSYHILLYFSTIVIFSKILIFTNIITLSGALETAVPQSTKNITSIIYHSLLIWYFTRPSVKKHFGERRGDLFSFRIPFLSRGRDSI